MIYRFDRFELDLLRYELRAGEKRLPVEPQVFALLTLLVENHDRVVSKDEIVEKVWGGRIVSEAAVSSRVKSARQALGDDGREQRLIRTTQGRGFRFVGEVHAQRAVEVGEAFEADRRTAAPNDPRGSIASSEATSESDRRPSIAVLPFRALGEAGAHATIAQALPHELIEELSRLRWLFVTARASSFRLGAGDRDPREIGRILGVGYCLSGTIELDGPELEVAVELVETRSGGMVWADRRRAPLADVHAIRAELRSRVLTALELQIPLHEAALARLVVPSDLDAWSAYHLGLQHMFRFNRADNEAATRLFERAVSRDPRFARAWAGLSFVRFQEAFLHHASNRAEASRAARDLAQRGLELDPIDPFVNFTMGRTHWLEGELESSLPWLDRAIAVCPNYAQGLYARGWTDALAGDPSESRSRIDLAMRLSPLDPLFYAMSATRAFTHLAVGEDQDAASWADRGARSPGAHVFIAMVAAATHTLAGNDERARWWTAEVRKRDARLGRGEFFASFPIRSSALRTRVEEGLRRLGF